MWGLEMNLDSSLVHGTSGCSHLTHRAGREPQPLGSTRVLAVHGGHKEGAKDPLGTGLSSRPWKWPREALLG